MIPNYWIFAPNFFNFEIIFALSVFETLFLIKVFNFSFHCSISLKYPVGKIWRSYDQGRDVAVVHSVRLEDPNHHGSLWVHTSEVVNILPRSGNINTTIQNHDGGEILITVSWSSFLFEVDDGWLNIGVRPICCVISEWVRNTYRPSYFSRRQQDLIQFLCTHHPIPSDTFPK